MYNPAQVDNPIHSNGLKLQYNSMQSSTNYTTINACTHCKLSYISYYMIIVEIYSLCQSTKSTPKHLAKQQK